ncbi:MAG: hypothetical protein EBR50_07615, partial [Proteobacteria bacterium]|nr:hypothetical protein [Pseudomonadota bacterium]
ALKEEQLTADREKQAAVQRQINSKLSEIETLESNLTKLTAELGSLESRINDKVQIKSSLENELKNLGGIDSIQKAIALNDVEKDIINLEKQKQQALISLNQDEISKAGLDIEKYNLEKELLETASDKARLDEGIKVAEQVIASNQPKTTSFNQTLSQLNNDISEVNQKGIDLQDKLVKAQDNLVAQKEAEEVIRQVKMAHKENPEQSIGVVTFNAPQQSLILDLMEANIPTLLRDPALFFVKNIENVQGDERDLIIFSTAYAKDNSGKLQLRFGSLNQVGGEHRLNVAVTRAKRRIIMITSIKSYDLQADQTKNLGPKLFRDYLEYVENLTSKKELAKEAPVNKHSAEWYLKSRMISEFEIDQRYQLKEALPFVDISVLDTQKNRYSGLIRTDDDLYFDAPSIKDIYVY